MPNYQEELENIIRNIKSVPYTTSKKITYRPPLIPREGLYGDEETKIIIEHHIKYTLTTNEVEKGIDLIENHNTKLSQETIIAFTTKYYSILKKQILTSSYSTALQIKYFIGLILESIDIDKAEAHYIDMYFNKATPSVAMRMMKIAIQKNDVQAAIAWGYFIVNDNDYLIKKLLPSCELMLHLYTLVKDEKLLIMCFHMARIEYDSKKNDASQIQAEYYMHHAFYTWCSHLMDGKLSHLFLGLKLKDKIPDFIESSIQLSAHAMLDDICETLISIVGSSIDFISSLRLDMNSQSEKEIEIKMTTKAVAEMLRIFGRTRNFLEKLNERPEKNHILEFIKKYCNSYLTLPKYTVQRNLFFTYSLIDTHASTDLVLGAIGQQIENSVGISR